MANEPVFGNYCGRCRRAKTDCVCAKTGKPAVPASQETIDRFNRPRFRDLTKSNPKSKINRQAILEKFGSRCAYCGEEITIKTMQVDHVVPQSDLEYNRKGDEFKKTDRFPDFIKHLRPSDINHPDNLFPACRVCNKWKNWFSLEEFRSEIQDQVNRLRRDSAAFRMAERYYLVVETDMKVEFHFEMYQKYQLQDHG